MNGLLFTSNQTAQTRRETVGGVEYLVAPVVAIKAGVLNGELVPAEEIQHHIEAWNGRPFVVGHPQDADGEEISANAPDLLAQLQAGQLFNVRFEGGALKGEVWVDITRAKLVDGGPEVMDRLEHGKPLEVSTAYLRDRDEKPGTLGGVEYEAVARNLRPDHLAALLDAEGACSWADGCGAPRVNQEDDMETNVLSKARRPTYTGTTDAPWEAPSLSDWLDAYPGDKPDTDQVADLPAAAKTWIAGHTLLGDPGADNIRDLAFFPVVTPQGKLSGGAVRAVLGARGVAARIPQAAKESAQAMARSLLDKEFKADAATNRIVCALQTLARAFGIEFNQDTDTEVNEMEKLIKAILEDGRLGLNEEQLTTLDEDVVKALLAHLRAMPKVEAEPETEANDDEQETEAQEQEAAPETNEALPADVTALAKALEARGGAEQVLALLDELRANQAGRKAELVTALVGNAACLFSKKQLAQMNADDLETLARSLSPADYSGRGGGPVSNTGAITPLVMPDIFAQEVA